MSRSRYPFHLPAMPAKSFFETMLRTSGDGAHCHFWQSKTDQRWYYMPAGEPREEGEGNRLPEGLAPVKDGDGTLWITSEAIAAKIGAIACQIDHHEEVIEDLKLAIDDLLQSRDALAAQGF